MIFIYMYFNLSEEDLKGCAMLTNWLRPGVVGNFTCYDKECTVQQPARAICQKGSHFMYHYYYITA